VAEIGSDAAVEVEGPLEGCVAGGADKSGSLKDGCHSLWRMKESPEGVSF